MKNTIIILFVFICANANAQYRGLLKTYPPEGASEPTPISSSTCIPIGLCTPIGDPYIGDCFAGLERYLARSIDMDGLAEMNMHHGTSDPCYDSIYACNNYPNNCAENQGGYCPSRYCEEIAMAVELKAAMVANVAGSWGKDNLKKPGTYLMNSVAQAVKDINRAYDCAGLRRPIIGAGITEQVDFSVYQLLIPQYVKDDFADELTSAEAVYYTTATNFDSNRIWAPVAPGTRGGIPMLSKIEARMYFYYLATMYIDLGYKLFYTDYIGNAKGYDTGTVYKLMKKVRQYATKKNTFIIIAGIKADSLFRDSSRMIFDYRTTASRPYETGQPGCPPSAYINTIITPNYDNALMFTDGGIGPYTTCNYSNSDFGPEARLPFTIGIDLHGGQGGLPNTYGPAPGGSVAAYIPWAEWVWGYDEARWLNELDPVCQMDWLHYRAYLIVKSYSHRAAFTLPGRKTLNNMQTGPSRQFYRMHDNSNIIGMTKNFTWVPDMSPAFTVTRYCFSGVLVYTFQVSTATPSTVYTWHIQKPGGSWEPYTYNTLRVFQPTVAGIHKIGLRCDNLGYPASDFGTRITDINLDVIFNCPPPMPHPNENGPTVSDEVKRQLISQLNLNAAVTGKKFSMEDEIYIVDQVTSNDNNSEPTNTIDKLGKFSPCTIYPNPANNAVNVSWNKPIQELMIVDVVGRVKKQVKASGENYSVNNIDISGLGTGIYFMKVKTATNIQTKSFTVQQ